MQGSQRLAQETKVPTGGEEYNHPQVWPWLSSWRALGEAGWGGVWAGTGQGARLELPAGLRGLHGPWGPGIHFLLPTSSSCKS